MEYEIIGTRPNSAFRVHLDYFFDKRDRFAVFLDPTTGGPCAVVYAGTDDRVDPAKVTVHRVRGESNYGKVTVDESPVRQSSGRTNKNPAGAGAAAAGELKEE